MTESNKYLRPYLSAFTRQSWERGVLAELTQERWRASAERHAHTSVDRKFGLAFDWLVRNSSVIGDQVTLDNGINYPLFDAQSTAEANRLFDYLEESGLISTVPRTMGNKKVEVTFKGWRQHEAEVNQAVASNKCFVAMWFTEEMFEVFNEAIDPAIRAAGFEPVVANRILHNDKVCDRIIAEIRRSTFVVADFTGNRGGAYFEAGFAMGLGRPVIFTCRKDHMEKVHFDTNHYNHITWQTSEDLKMQLEARIRATIVNSKSND